MRYYCDSCGFNWIRFEAGKARYCQRCGSDRISQIEFDIIRKLHKRLQECNIFIPPIVLEISLNRDPVRFSKPVLVIPEKKIASDKLVKKINILGNIFDNKLNFSLVKDTAKTPDEAYLIFMCDGRLYKDMSLVDASKLFSVYERGASLREMLFLLLYYPEVLSSDYFIVSPGSRHRAIHVPCAGFWKGVLTLTDFFTNQGHPQLGFATAEIF